MVTPPANVTCTRAERGQFLPLAFLPKFAMMIRMSNDKAIPMDLGRVRHVADLSRIALTDEQAQAFGQRMADILACFDDACGTVTEDLAGVEPMVSPVDAVNVLGPDTPRESLTPDAALANAPDRDGDYFKVPKVLGDSQ